MAYPLGSELVSFLATQEATIDAEVADRSVARAIARWEQATGFQPFLGSTEVVERKFDPPLGPNYRLDLRGGFWSITEIRVDASTGHTGVVLLSNEFDLLPLDAPDKNRGWDEVRFLMYPGSVPASIVVKGKRGYSQNLPADVFQAILEQAAAYAWPMAATPSRGSDSPGDVSRMKQGDREIQFDLTAGRSLVDRWETRFEQCIGRYMRVSM